MKKLVLSLLFCVLWSHSAFATLAMDGGTTSTGTSNPITTTSSNDVIVAAGTGGTSASQITAVSDTAGLTWVHRSHQSDSGTNLSFDEWYAIAPSPLTSDTVTYTYSGSSGRTWLFGISGANTTTPFDVNVSLPSYAASGASSVTSITNTISTTCAKTFTFDFLRQPSGSLGTITNPSGFTTLIASGLSSSLASEIVSTQFSSTPLTYSWTASSTVEAFVDSVQDASCSGAATTHFPLGILEQ